MTCDCFISYARKDSALADRIVDFLTDKGIKCWIDRKDSIAGLDYAASIVKAIKKSDIFILLISEWSVKSKYVLSELNTAVSSDIPIIPVNIGCVALTDAMEYYLGRTQWLNIDENGSAWHALLLNNIRSILEPQKSGSRSRLQIVQTHTDIHPKNKLSSANKRSCRVLSYSEMIDLGYTSKSIAMKLVENDYISYNGIADENEGTPDQWENYLRDESDNFHYLVNGNNEIVGDWSIVALTDKSMKRALTGDLTEDEFDITTTVKICIPQIYHGYILTCSILPEYRTQKNYLMLLNSFFKQIESYAETGVFFDGWAMNIFSSDVESLMITLGFQYVTDNKKSGKIYYLDFLPLPDHLYIRSFKKLVEYYEKAK